MSSAIVERKATNGHFQHLRATLEQKATNDQFQGLSDIVETKATNARFLELCAMVEQTTDQLRELSDLAGQKTTNDQFKEPCALVGLMTDAAPSDVAEPTRKHGACDLVLSMSDMTQPQQDTMEAGDLVELNGLRARPELNGRRAVLLDHRAEKDRWAAEMLDTSECLLLKSHNMMLIRKWRDAAKKREAGWEEADEG